MIEKVENGVIFGAPDIQKQLSDFSLRWHAMYKRASKDEWAKYEPVQMPLAGCTTVAIRVETLICSKLSTLKTAC
jgi:hypothetical protein